jgi:hypothetical protein
MESTMQILLSSLSICINITCSPRCLARDDLQLLYVAAAVAPYMLHMHIRLNPFALHV